MSKSKRYFNVKLAGVLDKEQVCRALVALGKEHETFESEDATTEEMDSNEIEAYTWAETKADPKSLKVLYPIVCVENDASVEKSIIVGACILLHRRVWDKKEKEQEWEILEFSVSPKHRRLGIGRQIVEFVIAFCQGKVKRKGKEKDVSTSIQAATHVNNHTALKFWNSLGFVTLEKGVTFTDRTVYGVGKYNVNVMTVR